MNKIYNIINIALLSFARLVCRPRKNPASKKSILIVRLDAIGDMVLFTPFLKALRLNEPATDIVLVLNPLVKNLFANCPYADQILYFDGRKAIKPMVLTSHLRAFFWGLKNLRGLHFDKVLLPRKGNDAEGAFMLAITSGAKEIIGYSQEQEEAESSFNKGYNKYLSRILDCKECLHEVEKNLNFLTELGYSDFITLNLELWVKAEDEIKASKFLYNHKINSKTDTIIAIGFSAAQDKRCWPIENFSTVIELLQSKYKNTKVILIGGPGDEDKAKYLISKNSSLISAVGKFSLRETVAILKSCDAYLGNDSGPMHLAAVAKTPVVEISSFPKGGDKSHQNAPERFGPWGVKAQILQPQQSLYPCINYCKARKAHCITEISTYAVVNAINSIL